MTDITDIYYISALELRRRLQAGEVSAIEVMQAFLERIDKINPTVNALCTISHDSAIEGATVAQARYGSNDNARPLEGMPIAIKDLALTRGMRTTFGSPIYADFVPDLDDLFVTRLRAAGAIVIGKTNTPEFGAGSQTFNTVFGATRNPYANDRTCGGSSGGAAAALASGMLPFADGSDLGGSLRNPASFCNVVGFRPSPGRVPIYPTELAWNSLPVIGPMAREVSDVAFLLSVMAGPDPRSPISLEQSPKQFLEPLVRDFKGTRIAFTPDLNLCPIESEVARVCNSAVVTLDSLGCEVNDAAPDVHDGAEIFQVLRASMVAAGLRADYKQNRERMKDTVVWNIEQGLALSAEDITSAEAGRTELYQRVLSFMKEYEFLVLPAAQVIPFDVDQPWVPEINGIPMDTYIDWMQICSIITLTGLPAISVPCGFSDDGLPIGLQIVGRRHQDFAVLQLAYAFEQATSYARQHPFP